MCTKRMILFVDCQHTYATETIKCRTALDRAGQVPCVPSTGHQRDLVQDLDAQDRNVPGKCPACRGLTPPSSQGSQ